MSGGTRWLRRLVRLVAFGNVVGLGAFGASWGPRPFGRGLYG